MAYTKEQRLINDMSGSTKQLRNEKHNAPPAGSFNIPNKSGDHYRSIKRQAPVQDYDLVNKEYVDDTAAEYLKLDGSNANTNIDIGTYDFTTTGQIKSKSLVINDVGGDNDTRFETDNFENFIFIDASEDYVIFGSNTAPEGSGLVNIYPPDVAAISGQTGTAGHNGFYFRSGAGGEVDCAGESSGAGGTGGLCKIDAGNGGSIQATSSPPFSFVGGIGGAVTIETGNGGAAFGSNNGFAGSVGGQAGQLTFTGGTGGSAIVTTGTNTGGKGGSCLFEGGAGGATSGGTTNNGGNGGDFTFRGGKAGSGSSSNGTPGDVIFQLYTGTTSFSEVLKLGNSGGATAKFSRHTTFIDNIKIRCGTGDDAEIYYDGTDLIIDSDGGAGSGSCKINTLEVRNDGTIKPVQLADASAPNDSIYYSTTQSKLVYKDSGGTVNNLY